MDESNNAQVFHILKLSSVYKHPKWKNNVNEGYDQAIIKLENNDKVKFNQIIQPAKLEARPIPENAKLYALGYGNVHNNSRGGTNMLRKTIVLNQNTDKCLKLMQQYPDEFPEDDVMNFIFVPNSFCLMRYNHVSNTAGQPCNGDSGGPVYTYDTAGNFAVAGTLSWGTPNKCILFTIYESTYHNRQWLNQFGDYFNYNL